jgi:hypothetical protein
VRDLVTSAPFSAATSSSCTAHCGPIRARTIDISDRADSTQLRADVGQIRVGTIPVKPGWLPLLRPHMTPYILPLLAA